MKRRQTAAAPPMQQACRGACRSSARAEPVPIDPVRFIVPYAPGGSTDTSSRIVAEKLAALLGQPVVIENKAGGGTIIGTELVARAKPDGYTILLTPAALIANAAFGVKVPYDIDKDLVPVVGFVDLAGAARRRRTTRRSSRSPSCSPMPRPIPAAQFLTRRPASAASRICGASM